MAALPISGTIRAVEINGVPYEPAADIDISEMVSEFENTSVPGYKFNMRKMTKRSPVREGIVLLTNEDDRAALKEVADSVADVTLSYINAAGDKITGPGWIEMENNTTAENRTTVQLHPRSGWTVVVGQDN
jgi:hypothetical protein